MSQRSLRGRFSGKSGHLQYWGRVFTQPLRTADIRQNVWNAVNTSRYSTL